MILHICFFVTCPNSTYIYHDLALFMMWCVYCPHCSSFKYRSFNQIFVNNGTILGVLDNWHCTDWMKSIMCCAVQERKSLPSLELSRLLLLLLWSWLFICTRIVSKDRYIVDKPVIKTSSRDYSKIDPMTEIILNSHWTIWL